MDCFLYFASSLDEARTLASITLVFGEEKEERKTISVEEKMNENNVKRGRKINAPSVASLVLLRKRV